jgi:hypothetical protein
MADSISGRLKDHGYEEDAESGSECQKHFSFKRARWVLTFNQRIRPNCGSSAYTAIVQRVAGRQHDFDFNIGTWKTHIRRLVHPLTGSNDWVDLNGTVRVRKVWNGLAQLEEVEADGSTGHFEGLTLFLYNPQAHQWGQYFANSAVGVVNQPQIGQFKNGRGELFDQESFNGRTIFVRFVWSDITPNTHHVEQSFSDDGGKTWEPNFVATLTRDEETSTGDEMPLTPAKMVGRFCPRNRGSSTNRKNSREVPSVQGEFE